MSDSPAKVLVDSAGEYLGTNANPLVTQHRSVSVTPFNELRVASDNVIGEYIFKYDLHDGAIAKDTATGGTITHVANESAAKMAVTTSSGSLARMRSHTYFKYYTGRTTTVRQVIYLGSTGNANQVAQWGIFDDDDGLFWQVSGSTLSVVRRTSTSGSPVDSTIATQAAFNYDALDGTGPSGVTIDPTKANLWEVRIQWYGTGHTVEFLVNQNLVHTENFSNIVPAPFTKTMNLPLHWRLYNSGASTVNTLSCTAASIIIGGSRLISAHTYSARNTVDVAVSNTALVPLLGIRPKATYNSIVNRAIITPYLAEVTSYGGAAIVEVWYNPTVTGGTWVSADSESHTERNITMTSISGGTLIFSGVVADGESRDLPVERAFNLIERTLILEGYANTQRTLVVAAQKLKGGSTDMRTTLNWAEED